MNYDLSGSTLVGRYQVGNLVARSQMTEVYHAYQPEVQRQVAIKILSSQIVEVPGVVEQFTRAVRASVILQHLNIERVYEAGTYEKTAFKVMEYIEGITLRALIEELTRQQLLLPLQVVGTIISQVASGLNFAFELDQSPLHRDVMPENIMLRRGKDSPDDMHGFVTSLGPSSVVLTDFGASRVVHDAALHVFPNDVPGLTDYMAPEMCSGERGVDTRADIYSLGVVLYELLTGTVPFAEGSPAEVKQQHISGAVPPPRTYRPDLPEAVEQVVLKALTTDRFQRFADAEAFGMAVKQRMGHIKAPMEFSPLPEGVPIRKRALSDVLAAPAAAPASPSRTASFARPPLGAKPAPPPDEPPDEPPDQSFAPAERQQSGVGLFVAFVVLVVVMLVVVAAGVWWVFLR